jgi:hypothetical protein
VIQGTVSLRPHKTALRVAAAETLGKMPPELVSPGYELSSDRISIGHLLSSTQCGEGGMPLARFEPTSARGADVLRKDPLEGYDREGSGRTRRGLIRGWTPDRRVSR